MTLFRVKLQFCLTVEAESAESAHKAVCKQIKEFPQSVISSVEDARYSNHRPAWKRLLWGR